MKDKVEEKALRDMAMSDEVSDTEELLDIEEAEDVENAEEHADENTEDVVFDQPMLVNGKNALDIFRKQAAQYPLLTAEQEYEAAKKVKENHDPKARETMINSNLRLVLHYASKYSGNGLSDEDLVQEGNIGLMKAVDMFDYSLGFRFSTYASWWIRQFMLRAIDDSGKTIRIPVHAKETIAKMKKLKQQYIQTQNREPTLEEYAEAVKLSPEKTEFYLHIEQRMATVSLSTPIGDDGDSVLEDVIPDYASMDVEQKIAQDSDADVLHKAMERLLTQREYDVICRRYGIHNGGSKETLEEVGAAYGLTRERIRQIENKAMNKLRRAPEIRKLRFDRIQ